MKDLKLLERIRSLLRRNKSGGDSSSLFSQKMEQQSRYRANLPGAKKGGSKKSLYRKWQDRKHLQSHQSRDRVGPAKAEKGSRRPLQWVLLALLLVLLLQLSGPALSTLS
ncbi:MAG: hypothetical protein ABFR63_09475, partial [Thermodesulfobacteriota bacterium]